MLRTAIAALTGLMLAGCGGAVNLRAGAPLLAGCEGASNCFSTQAVEKDERLEPVTYVGTREGAQQLMASIITVTPGARVVDKQDGYIHGTYESDMLGFVDDLELRFPEGAKVIEMRIASRSVHPAFGVNRKRIADLRKAFLDLQPD